MKNFLSARSTRSGFTLVELLVVIGIIAILATAVLAGASSAINAAKRLKAQNMASQIQTAVINYYTEYSVYPVPTTTVGDAYYDNKTAGSVTTGWECLTYTLCGNVNPINTGGPPQLTNLNSRNIAFFSPTKSDLDNLGIPKNPFTTVGAPEYYFIAMDTDYSNITGDSSPAQGQIPDFVASAGQTGLSSPQMINGGVPQGVCVWSNTSDTPYPGANPIHPQFWSHTY